MIRCVLAYPGPVQPVFREATASGTRQAACFLPSCTHDLLDFKLSSTLLHDWLAVSANTTISHLFYVMTSTFSKLMKELHSNSVYSFSNVLTIWHAPQYLRQHIKLLSDEPGQQRLRSSKTLELSVPHTRTSVGDRAFRVAGPSAWNSLPPSVQGAKTVVSFKQLLKTHLFRISYFDV